MGYKRIKRSGDKGVPSKGGPNDKGSFKKANRIGEATAKRMQEKLGRMKNKGKVDEDEIKSNDSDAWVDRDPDDPRNAKRQELLNDPFLQVDDEKDAMETVEEKRLRMTKNIINEYAREEKTDFFD